MHLHEQIHPSQPMTGILILVRAPSIATTERRNCPQNFIYNLYSQKQMPVDIRSYYIQAFSSKITRLSFWKSHGVV